MNSVTSRRPIRILLTGFAPFGGSKVNPSWEAVRRLRRARIPGVRVSVARLPVVWGEAERRLVAAIFRFRPDAVICVGQSAGRAWVSVETQAANRREGKDAKGRIPETREVIATRSRGRKAPPPAGSAGNLWGRPPGRDWGNTFIPESLTATLPVRRIVAALRRAGIPARLSRDAGRYLCNAAMYTACQAVGGTPVAGFIHVPMLPIQVQGPRSKVRCRRERGRDLGPWTSGRRLQPEPSLPLAAILRAVRIAVRTTAREIRGNLTRRG